MVVSYDMYGGSALHPWNKNEHGERLAQTVLGYHYKHDITWKFPLPVVYTPSGNAMRVRFDNSGQGLHARGGGAAIRGFVIAGSDQVFYPAEATVVGTNVVEVTSNSVASPVAVRYAWWENPVADLVGDGDLPASPFRSDDWELYPLDPTGAVTGPLQVTHDLPQGTPRPTTLVVPLAGSRLQDGSAVRYDPRGRAVCPMGRNSRSSGVFVVKR
jgi:hypothetical protein